MQSVTASSFSTSICHEVMRPDVTILVFFFFFFFLIFTLKLAASLSSFTLAHREAL